ncbi:MAG: peptide chain release factor N(5)-glutamine methyltransferase [Desulfomonilaceae bacterium]
MTKKIVNSRMIWTIKEVLNWTTQYLREKGCDTARLDAELLLAHSLGINRLRLYVNYDRPLSESERVNFRKLVKRRAAREPVALITGWKEFWSLKIAIMPGVLIPRPETELLVETILEESRQIPNCSLLEIGCGSGALVCAIASERQDFALYACDISLDALKCASNNASKLVSSNPIYLFASDLLESVRSIPLFDIIYSNPPYVPSGEINSLEPEIRYFEPRRALDGGVDGLETIRRLISMSRHTLKPKGKIIMEIGDSQSEDVSELLRLNDFHHIKTFVDLAGKCRVIKAVM